MFRNKKEFITVLHDGRVSFLVEDGGNRWTVAASLSLDRFAASDLAAGDIPAKLRGMKHRLMVTPDFWLENSTFQFQSKKRRLIEPYLARKIKEQYPDQEGIDCYFDYTAATTTEGMPGVYAFYLKDPLVFQMISCFRALHLEPERVSSAGYLWQSLLAGRVTGFARGGRALVQVMAGLCSIAIYVDGLFLFSRSVVLPEAEADGQVAYDEAVYELTQSLYLVSQKSKKEVDAIYLLADDAGAARALAAQFGEKINDLADFSFAVPQRLAMPELGPMGFLLEQGLLPRESFPWITHLEKRHEMQWALFQKTGIATGAVAALLLGVLLVFLAVEPGVITADIPAETETRLVELQGRLEEYRSILSGEVERQKKLPAEAVVAAVGLSLPSVFQVKKIELVNQQGGSVEVAGWVQADSAVALEQVLAGLVGQLHSRFAASASFGLRDFAITDEQHKGEKRFFVRFSFVHS